VPYQHVKHALLTPSFALSRVKIRCLSDSSAAHSHFLCRNFQQRTHDTAKLCQVDCFLYDVKFFFFMMEMCHGLAGRASSYGANKDELIQKSASKNIALMVPTFGY